MALCHVCWQEAEQARRKKVDALISIDKVHQPKCVSVARVDDYPISILNVLMRKDFLVRKIKKRRKFSTQTKLTFGSERRRCECV